MLSLIPPHYQFAAKLIAAALISAALSGGGAWIEHNRLMVKYQAEALSSRNAAIKARDEAVAAANRHAEDDRKAAVQAAVDAEKRRHGQSAQASKVEQSIAVHTEYKNCELAPDDLTLLRKAFGGEYD